MVALDDLARVLGGEVRRTDDQYWLETSIGGLRAAVIRRDDRGPSTITYDLAVITPQARELDPLYPHYDEWRFEQPIHALPRLRHGYVFVGCRAGVLFATTWASPELEHVVGALWDLAHLAREPWRPVTREDAERADRARRRRRMQRVLERLTFVAGVVIVAAIVRRPPR